MKQSLASMFELYLKRSDLRPSSIRFKRQAMKYFQNRFRGIPAGEVTVDDAEEYRTLLAQGRSKRSANGYLANFKPFWAWLFRHGLIPSNPFDGIRLYRITEVKRRTFSPDELGRMLQVSSRFWRVRICLGLLGMRRGEMLNLRRDNIRMSARSPHILLCPSKASASTWPWEIKDHAVRYVALPERMYFDDIVVNLHADVRELAKRPWPYICLEEHYYNKLIERQIKERSAKKQLSDIHAADPTGNFQRAFRQLQKQAGIIELRRYHELRAAFITAMIEKTDLSRAADAAGHSSVATTKAYHRYSEMSLVQEMSRVAEKCYESNVS